MKTIWGNWPKGMFDPPPTNGHGGGPRSCGLRWKRRLVTSVAATGLALGVMAGRAQEPAGPAPSPPPIPDAAPTNSAVTMFYYSLAPYGEWLWVEPYGWVWSPNNVAPDWRPYTDGSWAYTDCGWTWVS